VALAVASLVLTSALKLHPCYLCVFQRAMYLLLGALAVAAGLARGRGLALALGTLFILGAASGAGTAAYQVWLQAQPGAEFMCAGGDPNMIELLVDWLERQAPALFRVSGICASKELVILGVSLAGWSWAGFVASLLAGIWALARGRSESPSR
jgi:disulfide bond formation protein DsbB